MKDKFPLNELPQELLVYILLLAGSPQYVARFKRLSKSINQQLNEDEKKGPLNNYMQGYWRLLFQRDFNITVSSISKQNSLKLYKAAFKKRRLENSLQLSAIQIMLFEWICSDDLESIMLHKWDARDFSSLFNCEGYSPISLASSKQRTRILHYFYKKASRQIFSKNLFDHRGQSHFFWAAACGMLSEIKSRINVAFINHPNYQGATPLYIAAQNGHHEIVKTLISAGADINQARTDIGTTPLYIAAQKSHFDIVQTLIAAKANVNQARSNGETPLYAAAQYGNFNIVRALIKAGADVNNPCSDGTTPLYIAAQNGYFNIVRTLIKAGADVNTSCSDGTTPLCIDAQNGHHKIVKALITADADVNRAHPNGVTPLYIAAQYGNFNLVRALIKAGANVNQNCTKKDITAVWIAAKLGHLKVVQALIKTGAEVNKTSAKGTTPLYIAAQNGHVDIVQALIAAKANVNQARPNGATPLYIAAQNGHLNIVQGLIAAEADVNKTMPKGITPLYGAAQNGHVDIVHALISAKCDVNQASSKGTTSLYIAAQNGHLNVAQALIVAKADVNKARTNGVTPLYIAVQEGHFNVIQALIEAGANVNQARTDGVTPLYMAAQNGDLRVVQLLIQAGAQINLGYKGNTPLTIAKENNQHKIFALLNLWQVKTMLNNRPLHEQCIAILETPIQIENFVYTTFKSASTFFFKDPFTRLMGELKAAIKVNGVNSEVLIKNFLDKNRAVIPREKYEFITRYIVKTTGNSSANLEEKNSNTRFKNTEVPLLL